MKAIIGDATLYLGDCVGILPQIEANWCVTSPPYNLNKRYHTSPGASTAANAAMSAKYGAWYEDEMEEAAYQEQQKAVLRLLCAVCTDSVFYNHRLRYAWHNRNKDAPQCKVLHPMQWLGEFPIWAEVVWDRCGGSTPTGRYQQAHEYVYQIKKPTRWQKSRGMTDVWRIPPARSEGHVCAFPEKLAENCLIPHALPGEIVIDPYMGSGTVGVVAARLGLKFIGIEKDRKSFDLAVSRLEAANGP